MRKIINRIGERHQSNNYGWFIITDYINSKNLHVTFEEYPCIVKNIKYTDIQNGKVRNPYKPMLLGIGFCGQGIYSPTKHKLFYRKWVGMFERCYNEKQLSKNKHYIGCSVDEKWFNFQNFANWMDENYNPKTMKCWELDKDILVERNKLYSENTCCLVPKELNMLFLNQPNKKGNLPCGVVKNLKGFGATFKIKNVGNWLGTFKSIEEALENYTQYKIKHILHVTEIYKPLINDIIYQTIIKRYSTKNKK